MPRIPDLPPAARLPDPLPAAARCPVCGWLARGRGSARAAKAHCGATGHGVDIRYVRPDPPPPAAPSRDRRHHAVANRVLNALYRLDHAAPHDSAGPLPGGETTADIAERAGVTPAQAWAVLRRLLRLGLVRRRWLWRPVPERGD